MDGKAGDNQSHRVVFIGKSAVEMARGNEAKIV
jgi:hypothetical protein